MVPRNESQLRPQLLQRDLSANSAKQSYRSHSSSFEADDERSRSSDHEMGPDAGFRDDPSQYAGEDTRLTSRKELSGWYAYGFAAEVFVICGIGEFVSMIFGRIGLDIAVGVGHGWIQALDTTVKLELFWSF